MKEKSQNFSFPHFPRFQIIAHMSVFFMILSRSGLCQRPVLLPSGEQEELEEPEEHQEGQTHVLIPDV